MPTYLIYNQNSEQILRKVSCPRHLAITQLQDDELLIESDVNDTDYKVVDHVLTPYTSTEKENAEFLQKKETVPDFSILPRNTLDTELDNFISDYFLDRVNIVQWRIANYEILRKWAYPDPMIKNDADVKMSSGIPELISEGLNQYNQYVEDCLNVKTRFPKQ